MDRSEAFQSVLKGLDNVACSVAFSFGINQRRNMEAKRCFGTPALCLGIFLTAALGHPTTGQQPAAFRGTTGQSQSDPLAELSSENRSLFEELRTAAQQNDDATTLETGKKLIPALTPGTGLCDFVTGLAAGAAVEMGDTAYALTLLKPLTERHPDDWRSAALLARAYAEIGDSKSRDKQIAEVIALHKVSPDPAFKKLHVFPIQKVKLKSGSAVFLYPFETLKPYNTYLVALVNKSDGKQDYRLELESNEVDQAFFKPKKQGERRFSIDSYRKNDKNENWPESQSLYGFVDGVFNYDLMRDLMVKVANGEALPHN